MAKSRKPDYYISLLRNIKDLNAKINKAYELKNENKIYIFMVESFVYDTENHIHNNPLCCSLVRDICFLQSKGYDIHQVYESAFDLILFLVEHDDTIIKHLSNLKNFQR